MQLKTRAFDKVPGHKVAAGLLVKHMSGVRQTKGQVQTELGKFGVDSSLTFICAGTEFQARLQSRCSWALSVRQCLGQQAYQSTTKPSTKGRRGSERQMTGRGRPELEGFED